MGREKRTSRRLRAMWDACEIGKTRACGPVTRVQWQAQGHFENMFVGVASFGLLPGLRASGAEARDDYS